MATGIADTCEGCGRTTDGAVRGSMSYAYELVDHTCDETYFSCGLWLSLERAIAELNSCKEPEDCESPQELHDSDVAIFQIHPRKIGWGEFIQPVYRKTFRRIYDEADDDYIWVGIVEDLRR